VPSANCPLKLSVGVAAHYVMSSGFNEKRSQILPHITPLFEMTHVQVRIA
jgi:hypothetical protein